MTFREKLARAAERNHSLLCVGLDPDPERLPGTDLISFLRGVIEATSDLVCAFKANLAFYEQLGEEGYAALRAVRAAVPEEIPLIGDAKRGDVAHTAAAYARALFDQLGLDAATVNPYLGADAVEPFLEYADRGVFVVCRTSNPGARDLQDLEVAQGGGTRPLYQAVAELAQGWNSRGNAGLVVGATYPDEMRILREMCPELPFLAPGIGPQAGDLARAVEAGLDAQGGGIIVNASRQVIYASRERDFAEAARHQAEALRAAIEDARRARSRV
ncbi:MAG: orotidine-5'-phosphate decarboxylase [Chloroflexi bacterium]|nr:orotidine-5'-phosphate decarboxylase [Chloroflexota bacterium]